jgi:cell wall-associated NlpC family hydrolase
LLKKCILLCFVISIGVAGCVPQRAEQGAQPQGNLGQQINTKQYSVQNQGNSKGLKAQGTKGTPGAQGKQGAQGAQGAQGKQGAQGAQGTKQQEVKILINGDSYPVSSQSQNGMTYIPLITVLEYLDYVVREANNETTIQAGFTDVVHEVDKNSSKAMVNGEPVTLANPVITLQDETYITVKALDQLLGEGYNLQFNNSTLTIKSVEEDYGFPGNEDFGEVEIKEEEEVPTMSSALADRIIRTAKSYLGTPYKFGASSSTTSVFDCSSFTQRSYGTHGITLPRTSRAQAKLGTYIPVKDLRKGDLVFFNWPGRYQSNKVVGHVGIYMGNGYMIHTTPSKGVHIINAAKSRYWRSNYLGAKGIR